MDNVTDVTYCPLKGLKSNYVKTFRFNYTQNGQKKNWDLVISHDSVAIIIFNVTRKKLVFVKQFRPAVYFNSIDRSKEVSANALDTEKHPPSLGVTLELCAGIVDKNKPWEVIASEEILEECGYEIDPSKLEKVMAFRGDVGAQGCVQQLYYCEVTDDMKVAKGGGVSDEMIDVVEMSIEEAEKLLSAPSVQPSPSPPGFFFALTWFLYHKAKNF
ncbi:uridine diphosphate glucose pyrophosphatase NUDT14-like [Pectinophora gossypiella]|uniref:uridine diphosphate glucose pyrophosphatase NUDT14-like n=1 Tax=Pectinophora gossypiella TaxID=13191 RepID=UPI00214E669F|nr:uridine diphosphate glucose pyrophosphatase NUDT14-like [Pectinophora gossypiella]